MVRNQRNVNFAILFITAVNVSHIERNFACASRPSTLQFVVHVNRLRQLIRYLKKLLIMIKNCFYTQSTRRIQLVSKAFFQLIMLNRIAQSHLKIKGTIRDCKIDTGAQYKAIQKVLLMNLSPTHNIKPATIKISAYNGLEISVAGKCVASAKLKTYKINCYVLGSCYYGEQSPYLKQYFMSRPKA